MLRYLDDVVILGGDKTELYQLRRDIQEYLRPEGLELSNYQIFPVKSRGIDFVGYVSYPEYTRLRKSIKIRFHNMMKKYRNTKSIGSYYGWIKHCNGINLWNKYN